MKRILLSLTLALTLCLGLPALAAEETGIQVQLDGQTLTFTDAAPQVKDNRTFLPYRAVFEAMGAEVSNEGTLITATRGETTLTMTIGETTATLTTGEESETLTMDVAPYVDNATWRTYVPVRFAADAFGCNVGWDQATQTAIIVDVETLTEGLLTGEDYSLLNKFLDYSAQFNQGTWASEGTMTGTATMTGTPVMTLDGTVSGLTSEGTAADMQVTMDMDMTQLFTMLAAMQNTTPEALGMTEETMKLAMDMAMKMDMNAGTYYFSYGDQMNAQLGLPAGAWLTMDLGETLAQSGLDLETLKNLDLAQLLQSTLATYPLDGKSATGYTELVAAMDSLRATLSDKGFQKVDGGHETSFTLEQNGVAVTMVLNLTTNSKGAVVGYALDCDLVIALPEELTAPLAQQGFQGVESLTLFMDTAVDAKNHSTATVGVNLGQLFTMDLEMVMDYAKSDKTPDVTLPEGAVTVDFAALLAGLSAQQTPDQA